MPDEYEGVLLRGCLEPCMQVVDDPVNRLLLNGRSIARAEIGVIITAYTRELRYRGLDLFPVLGCPSTCRNQDHRRRPRSIAIAIDRYAAISDTDHSRFLRQCQTRNRQTDEDQNA